MNPHVLPFNAQPHPQPTGITTLDSIMVIAQSRGILNGGQYTKENPPPKHKLVIEATNRSQVEAKREDMGNSQRYTLTYEIYNFNDSPCFAYLEVLTQSE